jgi:hypothetical protein
LNHLSNIYILNIPIFRGNSSKLSKIKIAGTGQDPCESMKEFMSKDYILPLEHFNVYKGLKENIVIEQEKWSINTAAKCKNPTLIPKYQQYENYSFPRPDAEEVRKWQVGKMATDNYTLKFDEKNKKAPGEPRLCENKFKFGSHTETYKQGWVPNPIKEKGTNNRSSVPYNILNNDNNTLSGSVQSGILDKKLFNVKKGVAEIADLTRVTNPNYNARYAELYHENNNIFKGVKGIFTDMYDASHKNGNISLPFRRGANVGDGSEPKHHVIKRKNIHKSVDFGNHPRTTKRMTSIKIDSFNPVASANLSVVPATTTNLQE